MFSPSDTPFLPPSPFRLPDVYKIPVCACTMVSVAVVVMLVMISSHLRKRRVSVQFHPDRHLRAHIWERSLTLVAGSPS
jgi:hypothetical protein